MRSLKLCLERLNRLLLVLARQGGTETLRQFERRFGVWPSEVNQAAAFGWVEIQTRKPRTGRPSQIVRVCKKPSAKLPPWRDQIEREISTRPWWFALRSTHQAIKGGSNGFWRIPPYVEAYQRTYGNARSRAGARASMSRLLRHPDVKATRAWWYAKINNHVSQDEEMPTIASAIWRRFNPVKIIIRGD